MVLFFEIGDQVIPHQRSEGVLSSCGRHPSSFFPCLDLVLHGNRLQDVGAPMVPAECSAVVGCGLATVAQIPW
jgi:hypothetical protein